MDWVVWALFALYIRLTWRQRRLEKQMAVTQQQIDDLTKEAQDTAAELAQAKADFETFKTNVGTKVDGLNTQIAGLQQQLDDALKNGNALDISALQTGLDGAKAAGDDLANDIHSATI